MSVLFSTPYKGVSEMPAAKTAKRVKIVNKIMDILKDDEIFSTVDYISKGEDYIKQFMYPKLKEAIIDIHQNILKEGNKPIDIIKDNMLNEFIWEANKQQILHNMLFCGTSHRPDMEINIHNISLAIEVKKGSNGSSLREGIGQSIVYSSNYDFVTFLYIDTTKDKHIYNTFKLINTEDSKENQIIKGLWDNNNIMFDVI